MIYFFAMEAKKRKKERKEERKKALEKRIVSRWKFIMAK